MVIAALRWMLSCAAALVLAMTALTVAALIPARQLVHDPAVFSTISIRKGVAPSEAWLAEAAALEARGEIALATRLKRVAHAASRAENDHRSTDAKTSEAPTWSSDLGSVGLLGGGPAPLWMRVVGDRAGRPAENGPLGTSISSRRKVGLGGAFPALSLLGKGEPRRMLLTEIERSGGGLGVALLEAAAQPGWVYFSPRGQSAAAPLEVAVGLVGLLSLDRAWSDSVEASLVTAAQRGAAGEVDALAELEPFLMATLGHARELSYAELRVLAGSLREPTEWAALRAFLASASPALHAQNGGSSAAEKGTLPATLTSSELRWIAVWRTAQASRTAATGALEPLLAFFEASPVQADAALREAVLSGPAALDYWLNDPRPLWEAPTWWQVPDALLGLRTWGVNLAVARPAIASALHWGLLVLGGALLVLAVAGPVLWVEGGGTAGGARLLGLGLLLALAARGLLESELIQPAIDPAVTPRLDLMATMLSTQPPVVPTTALDQTAILVLVGFFALQLILYGISLAKLRQLKRLAVPSAVRLKLLDNEEHLFDAGLYVGLSGTVVSLVMLALGVVQASLVAAYASTLFGILFVALFKILHLRPLKQRILLDSKPASGGGDLPDRQATAGDPSAGAKVGSGESGGEALREKGTGQPQRQQPDRASPSKNPPPKGGSRNPKGGVTFE